MLWIEPSLPEAFAATPPPDDDWWYLDMPGIFTQSGNRVTEESAIRVSAVWSCVRLLSESKGQLPLHLYRRNGLDKERVLDHPAAQVVANPIGEMTRMEFVEHSTFHIETCGRAFWEIVPGRGRRTVLGSLLPHSPGNVSMFYNGREVTSATKLVPNGRMSYRVADGAGERTVPAERMIHFRGAMSRHPLFSLSPIGENREAIGAAEAAAMYGSRFFRNDSMPRGYLAWPGKIADQDAVDEVRRKWMAAQGGLGQHSVAVLANGMSYEALGITNEDAQFIETRGYNAKDIARIWRVPGHMINELSGAIRANVEQMGLEFVIYSLMSRLSRDEQRLNYSLLGPQDREEFFFEYSVDGLMRADIRSRYFAYRQSTGGAAWMTPNEIRRLENTPPHPDGDALYQPANMSMGPGPQGGDPVDPAEQDLIDQERQNAADALANAELTAVSAELETRSPARFANWARVYYDRMAAQVSIALDVSLDEGRKYAERQYAELLAAGEDGRRDVVEGWRSTKADSIKRLLGE